MRLVLLLSLLILIAGPIAASSQGTVVAGVVFDENGALIPRVKVKATQSDKIVETQADDFGAYSLTLAPGIHSLEFSSPYFETRVFRTYRVVDSTFGQKMNFDVVLEIAGRDNCGAGGCIEKSWEPICEPPGTISNTIATRPPIKLQSSQATGIKGRILDPQGAIMPKVVLRIQDRSGKVSSVEADSDGRYSIDLPAGEYTISIGNDRALYCPLQITNFLIPQLNGLITYDIVLKAGISSHAGEKCRTKTIKF